MRTTWWSAVAGVVVAGVLAGCGGSDDAAPPAAAPPPAPPPAAVQVDLPEGVTQDMVAAGQQIFNGAGICYTCHGQDGAGGSLGPGLRDQEWLHIDGSYESIVNNILNGVAQPIQYPAGMPARGGANISDEQVRQVAAYVYAISRGG
jgi:mono/diheme cytochrome c family protein